MLLSVLPQEVRALMLACLSDKPSDRPTAFQVLQSLRALVEGSAPPQGSHKPEAADSPAGATEAIAGASEAAAGATSPVEAGAGTPLRASSATSAQLRPMPASPFAA